MVLGDFSSSRPSDPFWFAKSNDPGREDGMNPFGDEAVANDADRFPRS
jgi:hypothetical protein